MKPYGIRRKEHADVDRDGVCKFGRSTRFGVWQPPRAKAAARRALKHRARNAARRMIREEA